MCKGTCEASDPSKSTRYSIEKRPANYVKAKYRQQYQGDSRNQSGTLTEDLYIATDLPDNRISNQNWPPPSFSSAICSSARKLGLFYKPTPLACWRFEQVLVSGKVLTLIKDMWHSGQSCHTFQLPTQLFRDAHPYKRLITLERCCGTFSAENEDKKDRTNPAL